jgi:hypothetical protein
VGLLRRPLPQPPRRPGARSSVQLVHQPDGHHAFDVADDTAASREVIGRVFAFLHRHLMARHLAGGVYGIKAPALYTGELPRLLASSVFGSMASRLIHAARPLHSPVGATELTLCGSGPHPLLSPTA